MPRAASSSSSATRPPPRGMPVKTAPLSDSIWAGQAIAGGGVTEAVDHVGGFEDAAGVGADDEPGVVVDLVEDLDVGAVGQRPVGGVELPAFVGLLGLEADERALRSLVGLGSDEPALGQDPPDRADRRAVPVSSLEMKRDGRRAGLVAGLVEVFADGDDLVFDRRVSPVRVSATVAAIAVRDQRRPRPRNAAPA